MEAPMRLIRGVAGAVLWILAAVLGLVAVILCVTVLLLPVGIPLLGLSRRLFTQGVRLMLPRSVAHPVKSAQESAGRRRDKTAAVSKEAVARVAKGARRSGLSSRRRSRWMFWKRAR